MVNVTERAKELFPDRERGDAQIVEHKRRLLLVGQGIT
jgi:hypothetical protein